LLGKKYTMKRLIFTTTICMALCLSMNGDANGRGFGGFGGFRAGGYGGFSGARSFSSYSGFRGSAATSSFDRSWTGARGGSISTEGTRGYASTPWGGAAGGSRSVTATGPEGRTVSGSRQGAVAAGPYGRVVGGGSRAGVASGPGGTVAGASRYGFAGTRFPTDLGLAHYSSFGAGAVGHSTAFWSHGYVSTHAGFVRTNFDYYGAFHPNWYQTHPGAWYPVGWGAAAAWRTATWASLATLWAIQVQPVYYDYGNTIVYQDNSVYVNGVDAGTAQAYAQQATTLADQGQAAPEAPKAEWTPMGVFALVQGEEKTSNNLFEIAVNKDGILRGNYYDGLMDTTTPIYGSVDKKSQRAAWTIGKKNDRVFETGIYNLTKSETPVLVHFGSARTQQLLLVRVEQPKAQQ
jgi:hypothetical protein